MDKTDRILVSFYNIESAIKYIKNNNTNIDNPLRKLSKKEYDRTIQSMDNLLKIINSLKYYNPIRHPKLDEIRSFNHSIKLLMDEEDYLALCGEAFKVHNKLNERMIKEDAQKLNNFKRVFKSLPPVLRKYLSFSEVNESGKVIYGRKKDNYVLITGQYLSASTSGYWEACVDE